MTSAEASAASPAARRKRRVWPWLVIGIALLVIVGAVLAEQIARAQVVATVKRGIAAVIELPESVQLEVDVPGLVVPQLIVGRIDRLTVAADDVSFGELTGDVSIVARGVAVRGGTDLESATADIRVDEETFTELVAGVSELPLESVDFDPPAMELAAKTQIFGIDIPILARVIPSARDGEVVIKTVSLSVAGASMDIDALRSQFGGLADVLGGTRTLCVAQYLPAGLTLDSITVEQGAVSASVIIDPAILSESALQQSGSCP